MKRYISAVLIFMMMCFATNARAQNMGADEFNKLKNLEGKWKGVKANGQKVEVNYKIMSNGSAIVETLMPESEPSMVTVYHMDGDMLMMTHYCSAGNQPRMTASVTEDGNLDFSFKDATNLKSKSEGHMEGLKIVFVDDNHFNQVWTWSKSDEEMPSTFEFEKVM